jgi:hypothetical protein
MLTCDLASRHFRSLRINDTFVFSAWAGAHVLPCVIFLMQANRGLKHHFRLLALTSARAHWWQRWRRRKNNN